MPGVFISISTPVSSVLHKNHLLKVQKRLEVRLAKNSVRRRLIRFGLLGFNLIILAIVILFIVQRSSSSNSINLGQVNTNSTTDASSDPLDQLSSADIALTVARVTNLPEATAVADQSQTVDAELALVPTDNSVAPEPQVVSTAYKSRFDIQTYVTQPGDSLQSVAAKFGITSNSVSWSNGNVTNITPGLSLLIPPVSGIVYTVKSGDTPQSLATKYGASLTQLVAYNDAEISGLQTGERIIIPNGQPPAVSNSAPSYNFFTATYGGNGYDFGYCTWYVATQIAVPTNWGNASSWAYYAALSGWNVSETPTVGAIAQTADAAGGEGHVAIVTAVSADGSQIQFKDMNGIAGWDRVGYSGWEAATTFQHYITH